MLLHPLVEIERLAALAEAGQVVHIGGELHRARPRRVERRLRLAPPLLHHPSECGMGTMIGTAGGLLSS